MIPTYNEADTILAALRELAQTLGPDRSATTEVLIADDGTDALPAVIAKASPSLGFAKLEVLRNSPPLGKGRSLARGFDHAQGEIVGFLDADLSTHPRYIQTAIAAIESGECDVFIASRRAPGAKVTREQFWLKDVLGDALRFGVNAMIFRGGPTYKDTQCGFKFFRRDTARALYRDLVAGDGLTDVEVLVRANQMRLRVKEQGVEWNDVRESKRSLRRILWGELKSLSRILYHYGWRAKQ